MDAESLNKKAHEKTLSILIEIHRKRGLGESLLTLIENSKAPYGYESFADAIAGTMNLNYSTLDFRLREMLYNLSVDINNQYSRIRNFFFVSDLKWEWFRYSGSNLVNTRPFCLAMTKKKYFHVCEIENILKGDFKEYIDLVNLPGYQDDEMSDYMYSETDTSNFLFFCGGYGCGHTCMPVTINSVPPEIANSVFASKEYKKWMNKRL